MSTPSVIAADVPAPFRAAFSTRRGGVSDGDFSSLNLGLLTDDDAASVLENRRRLLSSLGVDPGLAAMCRQVHGAVVTKADPIGVDTPAHHPERDGVWTDRPGEAVMVLSADCVPIVLCRRGERPAVAAVHAGWRGLLADVVGSAVAALGSNDLHASIGPAIGPCCYEVGVDVAEPFRDRFGAEVVRAESVDLHLAARRALNDLGVSDVETIDVCTACDAGRFFSHRRDRGRTGRQGLVAFIENPGS